MDDRVNPPVKIKLMKQNFWNGTDLIALEHSDTYHLVEDDNLTDDKLGYYKLNSIDVSTAHISYYAVCKVDQACQA